MKTIGMIGGMSWESTLTYYRLLNEAIQAECGGFHSANLLLASVDFAEFEVLMKQNAWDEIGNRLADISRKLESAGAEMLMLCTNTMHLVADQMEAAVRIPFLHIAEAMADAVAAKGLNTVALLGTNTTMRQTFFRERLTRRGIQVLVPDEETMDGIHRIIFEELCLGILSPESKAFYVRAINALATRGAEGVILGCTEIGLLIQQADTTLPVFDTTVVHAEKAIQMALSAVPLGTVPTGIDSAGTGSGEVSYE
jgi:aspartate racemase